jgi:hypothetical protein
MESRSPWMAALPSLPAYLVPLSWKEEVGQGDGCHRIRAYLLQLFTSALRLHLFIIRSPVYNLRHLFIWQSESSPPSPAPI